MNDKEYTYDIDKYTIGVDENGKDGIGMTVAKIENGEINFLGNCYGENARCIDLLIKENQELKNIINQIGFEPDEIAFLQQDNAELKKQVEEYKEQVNKGLYNTCLPYTTVYNKAIKDKETQQKKFIKYLEDESKEVYRDGGLRQNIFRQILQKYKSIIGDDK